ESVLDRQARCHDKKTARETIALGPPHRVYGLPRDEHRHDRRFAGTGCELEGQPAQFRICFFVCICQMLEQTLCTSAPMRCDFSEPNYGLHSFDLAKKGTYTSKVVVSPMFKETRCLRCDLPKITGQRSPVIHLLP